jgi:hypothetical protein
MLYRKADMLSEPEGYIVIVILVLACFGDLTTEVHRK